MQIKIRHEFQISAKLPNDQIMTATYNKASIDNRWKLKVGLGNDRPTYQAQGSTSRLLLRAVKTDPSAPEGVASALKEMLESQNMQSASQALAYPSSDHS